MENGKEPIAPESVFKSKDAREFTRLVKERQRIKVEIDRGKKSVDDINAQILGMMEATGEEKFVTGGWTVMKFNGRNTSISKTKLLEEGVSIQIIQAATVETPYTTVMVKTAPKAA